MLINNKIMNIISKNIKITSVTKEINNYSKNYVISNKFPNTCIDLYNKFDMLYEFSYALNYHSNNMGDLQNSSKYNTILKENYKRQLLSNVADPLVMQQNITTIYIDYKNIFNDEYFANVSLNRLLTPFNLNNKTILILDQFQELYKFNRNTSENSNSLLTLNTVKHLGKKDSISIILCGHPIISQLINGRNNF